MKTMFDYATVLATLQQIAPEAHIAGGAVRDTILQKQIHDIDVFMKDEHVEEAAALLRSQCSYVKVGEWKQYLGFSDPAMTRVAKFEKADETIPVCIIGLLPEFANPESQHRALRLWHLHGRIRRQADQCGRQSSTGTRRPTPSRCVAPTTWRNSLTRSPALRR